MTPDRIATLVAPFLGGATLTDTQLSQLAVYLDLLLRWNTRMNLTAVRDPEQMVTRHFGESLFAAQTLFPQLGTRDSRLVDIGSGAGFPGLPIKIWTPALRLTLLESNQRKATFLRELARTLQLTEVDVLSIRAETYTPKITVHQPPIPSFTITLRAVDRFDRILPTAVNLLQSCLAANRRLALLVGASQVAIAHEIAERISWSAPLPIPESSQRVLLVGTLP